MYEYNGKWYNCMFVAFCSQHFAPPLSESGRRSIPNTHRISTNVQRKGDRCSQKEEKREKTIKLMERTWKGRLDHLHQLNIYIVT
jgi:hypothetical protein